MIISIGGNMGSGKSTLAKKLAETLGWPRYYMGGLRREAAAKKGLTLAEYNKLGEIDPQTDLEVDEYQKKLGETEDNFVIEGRTSWHFIPQSLKLYIDVSDDEGARRIFEAGRNGEDNSVKTLKDALISLKTRKESDRKRYLKYFGINTYDLNNYDHIIDSTKLTREEVFEKAYGIIKEALAQK